MYRRKDRKTIPLFPELFPFGGKLDENNRWLRIAELIPWEELEEEYAKHFSDIGRPATDAQLVIGLLLLKHMTGLSDEGIVQDVLENPYMQAFCGYEKFVTEEILDPSTLTKMRERLGLEFFKELEAKTYKLLIERRIIKAKGMLVDATVFPEKIKYPNDVGLLNDVREWLVRNIKRIGKSIGKKYRTRPREARKEYLNFSKKKAKTKKTINKAKKKMLQYVRRNLKELKDAIEEVRATGREVKKQIIEKLKIAERIYHQQHKMYTEKTNRVEERIVSFTRPYVRPIKRGKQGKKTEFGGKGALVHVGGFLFMDYFEHRAFAEEELLAIILRAMCRVLGNCLLMRRWMQNMVQRRTGTLPIILESGPRLSVVGGNPKPLIPKTAGLRKSSGRGTGLKVVSGTEKNIMDSIESNIPSEMARRSGSELESWR